MEKEMPIYRNIRPYKSVIFEQQVIQEKPNCNISVFHIIDKTTKAIISIDMIKYILKCLIYYQIYTYIISIQIKQ